MKMEPDLMMGFCLGWGRLKLPAVDLEHLWRMEKSSRMVYYWGLEKQLELEH